MENNWISVDEQLPEKGKMVLAIETERWNDGVYSIAYWEFEKPGEWCDDYRKRIKPTHWMPLPEPPKQ